MCTHILVMFHTHLVVLFQAFHNWMDKLEKGWEGRVGDSRERKATTHSSQVTASWWPENKRRNRKSVKSIRKSTAVSGLLEKCNKLNLFCFFLSCFFFFLFFPLFWGIGNFPGTLKSSHILRWFLVSEKGLWWSENRLGKKWLLQMI